MCQSDKYAPLNERLLSRSIRNDTCHRGSIVARYYVFYTVIYIRDIIAHGNIDVFF